MAANESSPMNGDSPYNFASTGGWTLGKEQNGGAYLNKFRIVELTPEQVALVTQVAKSTYRHCCTNSTVFQDCNHGSAPRGLLQVGTYQRLRENELSPEAPAFNTFWSPQTYRQTAVYWKGKEWSREEGWTAG